MFRHLLLITMLAAANEALGADESMMGVAPPHGPMLMVYVSQPLWSTGGSRCYGLRLQQSGFTGINPPRSLVDLQLRRNADMRVDFGRRVSFDMGRREFNLISAH